MRSPTLPKALGKEYGKLVATAVPQNSPATFFHPQGPKDQSVAWKDELWPDEHGRPLSQQIRANLHDVTGPWLFETAFGSIEEFAGVMAAEVAVSLFDEYARHYHGPAYLQEPAYRESMLRVWIACRAHQHHWGLAGWMAGKGQAERDELRPLLQNGEDRFRSILVYALLTPERPNDPDRFKSSINAISERARSDTALKDLVDSLDRTMATVEYLVLLNRDIVSAAGADDLGPRLESIEKRFEERITTESYLPSLEQVLGMTAMDIVRLYQQSFSDPHSPGTVEGKSVNIVKDVLFDLEMAETLNSQLRDRTRICLKNFLVTKWSRARTDWWERLGSLRKSVHPGYAAKRLR